MISEPYKTHALNSIPRQNHPMKSEMHFTSKQTIQHQVPGIPMLRPVQNAPINRIEIAEIIIIIEAEVTIADVPNTRIGIHIKTDMHKIET
jgi:hypothetical protein